MQVHAVEDFLRRARPVVACPAADDRVEVFNECGLWTAPVLADHSIRFEEILICQKSK